MACLNQLRKQAAHAELDGEDRDSHQLQAAVTAVVCAGAMPFFTKR
jgi:hypothetical protein